MLLLTSAFAAHCSLLSTGSTGKSLWCLEPCLLSVADMCFPFDPCSLVSQVHNQLGLVTQQQPVAMSQLVPLPTAQQLKPLPTAAAAAATPALPQLSVQTSLKLQSQTSSLQPDLTAQLHHHTVPRSLPAQPDNNLVWVLSLCFHSVLSITGCMLCMLHRPL